MLKRNAPGEEDLTEETPNEPATPKPVTRTDVAPDVYINKVAQGIGNYVPTSWDDLVAYAEEHGGEIIEFEGSAWEILKDKRELVGVEFMIADVRTYSGKFGEAVAVMLVTRSPLPNHKDCRYVINDGSTGLQQQVTDMVLRTGRKAGILCPNGLRASDYMYEDETGKQIPATTFYVP